MRKLNVNNILKKMTENIGLVLIEYLYIMGGDTINFYGISLQKNLHLFSIWFHFKRFFSRNMKLSTSFSFAHKILNFFSLGKCLVRVIKSLLNSFASGEIRASILDYWFVWTCVHPHHYNTEKTFKVMCSCTYIENILITLLVCVAHTVSHVYNISS